jgi:hypothetical protein
MRSRRWWKEGLVFPEDTLADLRRIAQETGLEAKLPLS